MTTARPCLILCYHRVAAPASDPYRLCVSPENFRAQLRMLVRRADVVPIDEINRSSAQRRAVVTFDDGYADNFETALPIAEELGIPFTVYVTSGAVGTERGFWWDRLAATFAREIARPMDLRLRIGDRFLTFSFGAGVSQRQTFLGLHRELRGQPVAEIDRVLRELGEMLGVETCAPADAHALSEKQLFELAGAPQVTIGAHSTDHQLLSGRPLSEQLDTMVQSKQDLESALGDGVEHFAYPFGGRDALDRNSVRAARRAGFHTSVTTLPGSLRSGDWHHQLPRRLVMDWSARRFGLQLARWGMP